jgi:Acyl-CoA thioester hydrolase/BAAT N-terminal region
VLRPGALLVAALLVAPWVGTQAATLRVEPGPVVLEGEPIKLTVTGAAPGTLVTLRAERWRPGTRPRLMRSEAVYEADAMGHVEIDTVPA